MKRRSRISDDLLEVVFIATAADTVKMVEIKSGIQDDTYIQILSGLNEGDEVVTGPYSAVSRKLKEGDTIRKVDEEDLYSDKGK